MLNRVTGVIYEFQANNKKQGGLPVTDPPPRCIPNGRLEVIYAPSRPEYSKTHHKQVEAFTFWLKNCLKQHFLKNFKQDIILTDFVRNRSRINNIFTSGHSELFLFKVYSKTTRQTGGTFYFLIEKSSKTAFFDKNL